MLTVDTLPSNTRLYKAAAKEHMLIECRPPERAAGKKKVLDEGKLTKWPGELGEEAAIESPWPARRQPGWWKRSAHSLVCSIRTFAKLALYVEGSEPITLELAREVIGGWRGNDHLGTHGRRCRRQRCGGAPPTSIACCRRGNILRHCLAKCRGPCDAMRRRHASTSGGERQKQRVSLRDALLAAGFRQWPKDRACQSREPTQAVGARTSGPYVSRFVGGRFANQRLAFPCRPGAIRSGTTRAGHVAAESTGCGGARRSLNTSHTGAFAVYNDHLAFVSLRESILSKMSQLEVNAVTKEFPTRGEPLVILRELSLSLSGEENLAILGPSGLWQEYAATYRWRARRTDQRNCFA